MVQIKKGELLLLNANVEILNQCFKDLDEFGKEEVEKYNIVKSNQSKYYKKVNNMLKKAIDR
jgi:hypothetical protein